MKTISYELVKKFGPCYDPTEVGAKPGDEMTIPEFINTYRDKVKNKEDILWVLCRKRFMSDRDMRLFAVWCAREALKLVENPDPRSVEACNVAERYANGEATDEERDAAWAAAWAAARDAAWAAARDAARDAVWDAAWAAAWAAARDTAWAAAWADAWDAAWAAALDAQIDQLLTYFES